MWFILLWNKKPWLRKYSNDKVKPHKDLTMKKALILLNIAAAMLLELNGQTIPNEGFEEWASYVW